MATANQLLSLKEEATCSICLEYFTNPVSVDCGHIFCLFCISQYWKDLQTDFPCPECRDTCRRRRLRPNNRLANMVDTLKHLDVPSATPQDPNLCRKHEERLKLFCEDDQETICMVCSVSRDHKEHMVVPIREAAQEHKAKCLSYIDSLMKRREELRTVQRKEETNLRQLKDQFKSQEERITNEFEKLQQFLEEEKSCHLHNLKEKEKKSLQSIEQKVTRLEEKQIALRSLTTEISLKCHQQDVELLKVGLQTQYQHHKTNEKDS
ncbi:hypothetical protein NDU88_001406 [Pleurodeles waltl]|uniref:E3 ubiquitin-protein ligase TRIM39-like n=1 Tax=Pleurodeles waltl TaxID=8319 RepID=A0AAV7QA06_PLEWA|nr:hypothetical protein NDU88_001406 [Pleurodeles waltl]